MFLVASSTAQSAQFTWPNWIVFPQPRQRCSRFGSGIDGGNDVRPLASRLWRCVSRVAGVSDLDLPVHSICATYSPHGATSLPHVGAVAESCAQMPDRNRQLPDPVSKKSE